MSAGLLPAAEGAVESPSSPDGPAPGTLGQQMLDLLPPQDPDLFLAGELTVGGGVRLMRGGVVEQMPAPVQVGIRWLLGGETWLLRPLLAWYHASGKGSYRIADGERVDLGLFGTWTEPYLRGSLSIDVDEIATGAAHTWRWHEWRITASGGPSWLRARGEDEPSATLWRQRFPGTQPPHREDSGTRIGLWTAVSGEIQVGGAVLGMEGRWTRAPMTLLGWDMETGGLQISGSLSWGW